MPRGDHVKPTKRPLHLAKPAPGPLIRCVNMVYNRRRIRAGGKADEGCVGKGAKGSVFEGGGAILFQAAGRISQEKRWHLLDGKEWHQIPQLR